MAVQNPPWPIQAGSHAAELVRRSTEALAGGRGGIISPGDLAVAENGTPNMTVNVAAGRVLVPGSESAFQGHYFCESRATENRAIAAADATNARKDLIIARVKDAAYSGATNSWDVEVVTGTPAPSPSEPAVPANSWVLAMVDVPALDTAITNSQITDRRTQQTGQKGRAAALGGMITCTSTNRPGAPVEGMKIYETDTDRVLIYDGANWIRMGATAVGGRTGCRLRRAAAQSIASGVTTNINFDTEDQDTDGFIAVTSDTVTIPAGLGGLYAISWNVLCTGITGASGFMLAVTSGITGMPADFSQTTESTLYDRGSLGLVIPLLAGDSFVLQGRHSTGSAQNYTAWLSCYRLGA